MAPKGFSAIENGKTYIENAYKKAVKLSKLIKGIAFSDDSGIEIYAMNKKPGIKSSRFFNNGNGMLKIIETVKSKENKKCRFCCAIVVTDEKGKILFKTTKYWYGIISDKPKGLNGFGYDPIFYLPKLRKTSAELSPDKKNEISHRGKAINELANWLRTNCKI